VAFLVVYREGAETALFYQALLQTANASLPHIMAGLATGVIALVVVYIASNRLTKRLPLRRFFAVTGALLYAMAFSFMGKGLRELQEGGALQSTPIPGWPTIDAIGVYPSVETLVGQGALVVLFLFACWYSFFRPSVIARRRVRAAQDQASAELASTPARMPQSPVRSSAPL
jgi:high-affinity iron transporter